MAVNRNGITGNFRGRIGNIVGYELNDQQVMRTLPKERTTPPTAKELLNRMKFKASQNWLEPLTHFLRIGFKDYRPTYQGFVAAKSYNQKNAMAYDEATGFYIDPALALVSYGTLELPSNATANARPDQEIAFNWSLEVPSAFNDQAMLIAYDIENEIVRYHTAAAPRNTGAALLKLQPRDKGKTFHLYLAFITDDRSEKSNSMYLGRVVVE